MADMLKEIKESLIKAMKTLDDHRKTLTEEIKEESKEIVDKAAESTETLIKKIDSHIERLKGAVENEEESSLDKLDTFLSTLKEDIKDLTEVVNRRAKELSLAVKKSTELLLDEVRDEFDRVEAFIAKRGEELAGEDDEEKRSEIMDKISERLGELGASLRSKITELTDVGEEASAKVVRGLEEQVNVLRKRIAEMRGALEVKMEPSRTKAEKKVKKVTKKVKKA